MFIDKPLATLSFGCCKKQPLFALEDEIDSDSYNYEFILCSTDFELVWSPTKCILSELIEVEFCSCVKRVIKITLNRSKKVSISDCKIETYTKQEGKTVKSLRNHQRPFYYVFGDNIIRIRFLFHVKKTA